MSKRKELKLPKSVVRGGKEYRVLQLTEGEYDKQIQVEGFMAFAEEPRRRRLTYWWNLDDCDSVNWKEETGSLGKNIKIIKETGVSTDRVREILENGGRAWQNELEITQKNDCLCCLDGSYIMRYDSDVFSVEYEIEANCTDCLIRDPSSGLSTAMCDECRFSGTASLWSPLLLFKSGIEFTV